MNFIWPQALLLLLFVPLYIYLNFYFERKRKKDVIPFGNLEALIEAISNTKKIDFLKHFPLILKTFILILLIIAITRPISTIYLPMRDTKVMLLIDNSISMEAEDIRPNRIIAAREAAKQFVENLPKGIQVGIGLFSGNVKILVNPDLDSSKVFAQIVTTGLGKGKHTIAVQIHAPKNITIVRASPKKVHVIVP